MFLSACDSVYNQGMRLTLEYMAGALLVVLSFFSAMFLDEDTLFTILSADN